MPLALLVGLGLQNTASSSAHPILETVSAFWNELHGPRHVVCFRFSLIQLIPHGFCSASLALAVMAKCRNMEGS